MNRRKEFSIAVIIPVFNDAAALERLLGRLLLHWDRRDICVVDGCSADDSPTVAEHAAVQLVHANSPCRARQMNQGAAALSREGYWFLHADAIPPPHSKTMIQETLASGYVGGAFSRRFDSPSKTLLVTSWLADRRGRLLGWFLGDQGIFIKRSLFESLGGFPDLPLFEDLELSRSLAKAGKVALLRPPLITSARRFQRLGPWRQTLAGLRLTIRHLRGKARSPSETSPNAREYGKIAGNKKPRPTSVSS